MPTKSCAVCGYEPTSPRNLYYSVMMQRTQCVNAVACKKRAEKKESK